MIRTSFATFEKTVENRCYLLVDQAGRNRQVGDGSDKEIDDRFDKAIVADVKGTKQEEAR